MSRVELLSRVLAPHSDSSSVAFIQVDGSRRRVMGRHTHIDLTRCKTIPPEAVRAMSSCTRKARSWKLRMTLVHFLPQIHTSGPVILQWQFYERALSRSIPSTECFLSDAWLLSPFFFGLTGGVTEFATLCLLFIPQTTEYAPTDEAAMDPDLYSMMHINISSIDLSDMNLTYVRLRRDVIFRCICHPDSGDSGDDAADRC